MVERALLSRRVRRAFSQSPTGRQWLETVSTAVLFGLIAFPIAAAGGLVRPGAQGQAAALIFLALRVLLVPALLEETVFRVLLNPHRSEGTGIKRAWLAGVGSLVAYVLVHPLVALVVPAAGAFLTASFLLLTTLLGLACLVLYRRSGSVWPPMALHWLVVVGWLSLGGQGVLSTA